MVLMISASANSSSHLRGKEKPQLQSHHIKLRPTGSSCPCCCMECLANKSRLQFPESQPFSTNWYAAGPTINTSTSGLARVNAERKLKQQSVLSRKNKKEKQKWNPQWFLCMRADLGPRNWKVAGWISGQGTCQVEGSVPGQDVYKNGKVSLSSINKHALRRE